MHDIHVSVGAGFENDRRDLGGMAAKALAMFAGPRYLIFECLAERTLAKQVQANDLSAQIALATSYVLPCWDLCQRHGIRIVSNFGGIDPKAVAKGLHDALGGKARVAAVSGDAIPIRPDEDASTISKNVYLGASGIAEALAKGAEIVVTGRVADPSLVVGPVIHEHQLADDDWNALANATLAGHLIECGTQVTGGYFADLDKPVPDFASLGPPVATIAQDKVTLTKPLGGGVLNRATVTEQLLYEIGDPAKYLTPDVCLDMTKVQLEEQGTNKVLLTGAKGQPAPASLKMLTCRNAGWLAEGEISYLGDTAKDRAKLAEDILKHRLRGTDMRIDVFAGATSGAPCARLRLAARTPDKEAAERAINEVEALYLNGPAGGGGVRKSLTSQITTDASLVARSDLLPPQVEFIQ
ncbi:MAG: acyclic terpene utilization AtuA family protein [Pseudomonadota bacterium]